MAWATTVEAALGYAPMGPAPVYTDLSAYLSPRAPVTITVGRPDAFGQVQPSTLSLVLDNSDGRFTRFLTIGAYYPNIKNGVRIRVKVVRNAVTYDRFDGHVNEWPTQWAFGVATYAEAPVTATGRSKRFYQRGELRSMLEEEILYDAGADNAAYYPLSEPAEAASVASVAKTTQGYGAIAQQGAGGALEFGAGTGPGTDELSAAVFTRAGPTAGKYLAADLPNPVGGPAGFTLGCWFTTTANTTRLLEASVGTPLTFGDPSFNTLALSVNASGGVTADRYTGTLAYSLVYSGVAYNDGLTHQVVVTETISGSTVTARLYIDGVQRDAATYTASAIAAMTRLWVGYRPDNVGGWGIYTGTMSHVFALSGGISATRVLAQFNAGANGLSGERTDQRIGRIDDWIGIPSADRAFDVGDSTVGWQATSGQQPDTAHQEVVETEQGVLFFGRDGKHVFHSRSRRYNDAVAVTLPATQLAEAPSIPGDDTDITNDMTVTRKRGAPARSVNQASIDAYGLFRGSAEIVADNDAAAQALANWRANNYAEPRTRVPDVTVDLHALEVVAPSQVPLLLAADISSKLRLSSLPAQAPVPAIDVFVEGYTESFDARKWRVAFNTSPAEYYAVWQLGVSGASELGVTTRIAF
jgi:hypothetical protein